MTRFAWMASAVLLLSGCADDEDSPPTTLPDLPTKTEMSTPDGAHSPTTTPTSTPSPPKLPPNAHDYTADGVKTFTRYAIKVINYAYQTNDVSHLKELASQNCDACGGIIDEIEIYQENGGWVSGGLMLPEWYDTPGPISSVKITSVVVNLVVSASTTYDSEGKVADSHVDRKRQYIFDLERKGAEWRLDAIRHGAPRS